MSDSAPAGSVAADAPPAGTPAQPPGNADNGSAAPPAQNDPFSGLSEGTRGWVTTKGYESVEAALAGGMNAEQKLGSAITVPGADAKPEEWSAFYSKLPEKMRPVESPDKLTFKRPDNLPADLPYSDELANSFKGMAHKHKLNPEQAQGVHDDFVQWQTAQVQVAQAAVAKAVEASHDELVKVWGPKDSEGFKREHEMANRAIKKLGLVESAKRSGILLPDGTLTDAQFAKAMAAVGREKFAEDKIDHGSPPAGVNPWKGEGNITQQSAIKKSDPALARRLIREAGKDPASYGL